MKSPPSTAMSSAASPNAPLLTKRRGKGANDLESFDYCRFVNDDHVAAATHKIEGRKQIMGYTGKTFVRWMFTWGIGVTLGILAYIIDKASEHLNDNRRRMIRHQIDLNTNPFAIFIAYSLWNLVACSIGSLLVLFVAPPAASSGIPEVKAILNGIHLPGALSFRCFVAKTIGTIGAVSSGLVLGPEGPLVHLGAMIGSAVTRGEKNIRFTLFGRRYDFGSLKNSWLMQFRNDIERRDFITIGAASGFAAAFGAPIGGVLFALEEATSYWSDRLMWRALTATTIATVTLHEVAKARQTGGDLSDYGLISLKTDLGTYAKNPTSILIPCAILGIFGGILGAAFNASYQRFSRWGWFRPKLCAQNWRHCFGILVSISLLTSIITFWLPYIAGNVPGWGCRPRDAIISDTKYGQISLKLNNTLLPCEQIPGLASTELADCREERDFFFRFYCNETQVNDIASIMLGNREQAIVRLVDMREKTFHWKTLFSVFITFLPLMALTFGSATPMGIFMPSILIGCCGGGVFGKLVGVFFPTSSIATMDQGVLALMGAVAMLGGIQRSAISLCVIIMEGTQQVQFLLPIICTTVFARYVGNMFGEGLYEVALHVKHMPFLHHVSEKKFIRHKVEAIMSRPVKQLVIGMSPREMLEVVESCDHHGFPVVDSGEHAHLRGIMLREKMLELLRDRGHTRTASDDQPVWSIFGGQLEGFGAQQNGAGGGGHGGGGGGAIALDKVMNRALHTVTEDCPLHHAYELFITMGMRHLIVVDKRGRVSGMVTRADWHHALHNVSSKGWQDRPLAPLSQQSADGGDSAQPMLVGWEQQQRQQQQQQQGFSNGASNMPLGAAASL